MHSLANGMGCDCFACTETDNCKNFTRPIDYRNGTPVLPCLGALWLEVTTNFKMLSEAEAMVAFDRNGKSSAVIWTTLNDCCCPVELLYE